MAHSATDPADRPPWAASPEPASCAKKRHRRLDEALLADKALQGLERQPAALRGLDEGWFLSALSVCACQAVARRDARQSFAFASAYARVTPTARRCHQQAPLILMRRARRRRARRMVRLRHVVRAVCGEAAPEMPRGCWCASCSALATVRLAVLKAALARLRLVAVSSPRKAAPNTQLVAERH